LQEEVLVHKNLHQEQDPGLRSLQVSTIPGNGNGKREYSVSEISAKNQFLSSPLSIEI